MDHYNSGDETIITNKKSDQSSLKVDENDTDIVKQIRIT